MKDKDETEQEKPEQDQEDNSQEDNSQKDSENWPEIIKTAKKRFKRGISAQRDNRVRYEEDLKFIDGQNHWDKDLKTIREEDGRPVMTVNRMPGFVRNVVNDAKQNPPGMKVSPVDGKADVDTADVFRGLFRHIESDSNADTAYDTAFHNAVGGGMGFFRLRNVEDENPFQQKLVIDEIRNSLSVVYDSDNGSLDSAEWKWLFITDRILKEEFEEQHPDFDVTGFVMEEDDEGGNWISEDEVRIAEYYYFSDPQDVVVALLRDGSVVDADTVQADQRGEILDTKVIQRPQLKWCLLAGNAEKPLASADIPCKWIPVFGVFGDSLEIDGEVRLYSLIHHAKDSQRIYNFAKTAIAEAAALQPKVPFIGAEGQFEGFEEQWDNANRLALSKLEYKPVSVSGVLAPPPRREMPAPISPALEQLAIGSDQDIMNTIGLFDASLGRGGNETSGRAILARQREGDISTYHFKDNRRKAIRQCARCAVNMIPKIYDTPRIVRILGEDGVEEMRQINQAFEDKDDKGNPITRIYDLNVGRYDVVLSEGASYNTRRQEAADHLVQIMQGNPQFMAQFGDIIFKNMDWPGAEAVAARFEKMLPPELVDGDREAPELPPEVIQQLQQSQQMIAQMDAVIQNMSAELESREAETMLKQAEIQVEQFEAETKRLVALGQEKDSDLTEAEKINHEAELKIRLEEMRQEHEQEMELFKANFQLKMKNQDEMVEDFDEEGNPLPSQLAETLGSLQQITVNTAKGVNELLTENQKLKAPKEIVRDPETGEIVGVRQAGEFKAVVRDENGNIEGTE